MRIPSWYKASDVFFGINRRGDGEKMKIFQNKLLRLLTLFGTCLSTNAFFRHRTHSPNTVIRRKLRCRYRCRGAIRKLDFWSQSKKSNGALAMGDLWLDVPVAEIHFRWHVIVIYCDYCSRTCFLDAFCTTSAQFNKYMDLIHA